VGGTNQFVGSASADESELRMARADLEKLGVG